jgi:hypothetical protein
VDQVIAPFAAARDHLDSITGVGRRAAECIIAEVGVDMSALPTAAHLASWAGRCPGNNVSGGRRRSGKPTKGSRWLAEVLTSAPGPPHTAVTPTWPRSSGGWPGGSARRRRCSRSATPSW